MPTIRVQCSIVSRPCFRMRGAQTYVGAGHLPHVTHPSEFVAVVADYAAR